jgi:transcriptional regulator with XRE-family HTH domain
MKSARLNQLPKKMRDELVETRRKRGWTQAELGRRIGLPQVHISNIENGKVVPRFDTLLDLVRVLDRDLLLVPRSLVPVVQGLIRDVASKSALDEGDRPLYALQEGEEDWSNET